MSNSRIRSRRRDKYRRNSRSSIIPVMSAPSSTAQNTMTGGGGGGGAENLAKRTRKASQRTFTKKDFYSGDGMLTTVWGPSMWHFLHTMSFNYPVSPTEEQKTQYMDFMLSLQYVLPCKYCRMNLTNNFKKNPLKTCHMASRDTFSRFVYGLHETVNKMLGKKSGLTYCDVRERYEHFRSRCTQDAPKIFDFSKLPKTNEKEKGCTEPLYGEKAKCVISIVPQEVEVPTFQVDDKCIKKRGDLIGKN
jgi:hypothetical protein